jgi:hypothetical protein
VCCKNLVQINCMNVRKVCQLISVLSKADFLVCNCCVTASKFDGCRARAQPLVDAQNQRHVLPSRLLEDFNVG